MSVPTSRGRSSKQKNQRKAKKKNYVSPKLVEYGALTELTKMSGSGAIGDGGGFMQDNPHHG